MRATRLTLITATVISALIFLWLTFDTLRQMPARTHASELTAQVVAGKHVWQHYDCNNCHTILGIGGYYAPDVTKTYAIRGDAWLRQFLHDPARMYPDARQMPNFRLSETQIDSLVAYFKWVSQIDTNGWPPAPLAAAQQENEAHKIFVAQHCDACHAVHGIGGTLAPDLSHVGSLRTQGWILDQLNNPRAHKPDSIMPGFAALPDLQKQELAQYLAGLK